MASAQVQPFPQQTRTKRCRDEMDDFDEGDARSKRSRGSEEHSPTLTQPKNSVEATVEAALAPLTKEYSARLAEQEGQIRLLSAANAQLADRLAETEWKIRLLAEALHGLQRPPTPTYYS